MLNNFMLRFADSEGRLKIWPAKYTMKLLALEFMSQKFKISREYTEQEVNAIINEWHTFGDYFLLRRGMVDAGFMKRTKDGSRYWREEKQDNNAKQM